MTQQDKKTPQKDDAVEGNVLPEPKLKFASLTLGEVWRKVKTPVMLGAGAMIGFVAYGLLDRCNYEDCYILEDHDEEPLEIE